MTNDNVLDFIKKEKVIAEKIYPPILDLTDKLWDLATEEVINLSLSERGPVMWHSFMRTVALISAASIIENKHDKKTSAGMAKNSIKFILKYIDFYLKKFDIEYNLEEEIKDEQ